MVGLGRLERPTSPLSGVRSNHLSYRPQPKRAPCNALVDVSGIEKRSEDGSVPQNELLTEALMFQVLRERRRKPSRQRASLERR